MAANDDDPLRPHHIVIAVLCRLYLGVVTLVASAWTCGEGIAQMMRGAKVAAQDPHNTHLINAGSTALVNGIIILAVGLGFQRIADW